MAGGFFRISEKLSEFFFLGGGGGLFLSAAGLDSELLF